MVSFQSIANEEKDGHKQSITVESTVLTKRPEKVNALYPHPVQCSMEMAGEHFVEISLCLLFKWQMDGKRRSRECSQALPIDKMTSLGEERERRDAKNVRTLWSAHSKDPKRKNMCIYINTVIPLLAWEMNDSFLLELTTRRKAAMLLAKIGHLYTQGDHLDKSKWVIVTCMPTTSSQVTHPTILELGTWPSCNTVDTPLRSNLSFVVLPVSHCPR